MTTTEVPTDRLGANYYKLMAASTISNLGDGIGVIAYPWLASAVTRNPILIAGVAAAQRLPWLLFTLPAGVITDRNDRRRLMVGSNVVRAFLTLGVAAAVMLRQDSLPSPDQAAAGEVLGTNVGLYLMIVVATMLLGMAEVLYDNSAQTFMPAIVSQPNLEKANGRLWSVEMVANQFLGPPLAGVLLLLAFSLPFYVDAATFAVSAALIAAIAATPRVRTKPAAAADADADAGSGTVISGWVGEAKQGFVWLWRHPLLRPLAISLGLFNLLSNGVFAVMVLFAQEVLQTGSTEFALLMTGGAAGGVVGGWAASSLADRFGDGPSLWIAVAVNGAMTVVAGLVSRWPIVWLTFAVSTVFAVLWNVITVSFRQTVIPDELLGRVNSVYRLFGWGMIPIGAIVGGLIVTVSESFGWTRELSLRMPFLVLGVGHLLLLAYAAPRLTSAKFAAARIEARAEPT
ncbi:MAG: MFS transporter [Acidimicrobiia bacterium]|nr:MFS transporter [Acidimicrobiia bacterium]